MDACAPRRECLVPSSSPVSTPSHPPCLPLTFTQPLAKPRKIAQDAPSGECPGLWPLVQGSEGLVPPWASCRHRLWRQSAGTVEVELQRVCTLWGVGGGVPRPPDPLPASHPPSSGEGGSHRPRVRHLAGGCFVSENISTLTQAPFSAPAASSFLTLHRGPSPCPS